MLPSRKKVDKKVEKDVADSKIEAFLTQSALAPPEWYRLVHDCQAVWAPTQHSSVDVSQAAIKKSLAILPPGAALTMQLTASESQMVEHILSLTDPKIVPSRLSESGIVCGALASIVLFVRGPASEIYTECSEMMTVRAGFQALVHDTPFTFFDGFNDLQTISEQDQIRVRREIHQREALRTLESCLNDIGKVKLSTLTNLAAQPIPEVYRITLRYLQV